MDILYMFQTIKVTFHLSNITLNAQLFFHSPSMTLWFSEKHQQDQEETTQ